MQKKPSALKVDRISLSMPKDISAWLRRAAAKRRTSISQIVKDALLPQFDARHAK